MIQEDWNLQQALYGKEATWKIDAKASLCKFPEKVTKDMVLEAGFRIIEEKVTGGKRRVDVSRISQWKEFDMEITGTKYLTVPNDKYSCSYIVRDLKHLRLICRKDRERKEYINDEIRELILCFE